MPLDPIAKTSEWVERELKTARMLLQAIDREKGDLEARALTVAKILVAHTAARWQGMARAVEEMADENDVEGNLTPVRTRKDECIGASRALRTAARGMRQESEALMAGIGIQLQRAEPDVEAAAAPATTTATPPADMDRAPGPVVLRQVEPLPTPPAGSCPHGCDRNYDGTHQVGCPLAHKVEREDVDGDEWKGRG